MSPSYERRKQRGHAITLYRKKLQSKHVNGRKGAALSTLFLQQKSFYSWDK
jgi:hypothetical protein